MTDSSSRSGVADQIEQGIAAALKAHDVAAVIAQAAADTHGSPALVALALIVLAAMLRGGTRKTIRWEYTQGGRTRSTPWYDSDTHYLWRDPADPTHYAVRRRADR